MGQRLNVEIVSNGKLLANAYYHWDAYTGKSLQRTDDILADPELSKYLPINDCVDRNKGILSITKEGMQNTRNWEEGRVTIDICKRTILFRVYWELTKEEYLDDSFRDPEDYEQLPTIDYDLEKEIPFDKFEELKNLYTNTIDTYGFKRPDGSAVGWIE